MKFHIHDDNSYSNVIGPKTLQKRIKNTLQFKAAVSKRTLGPYGMNAILEDQMLHHVVTKDGNMTYQNLVLYGRVERVISQLFKHVSGSLNEVVGDGTTSSIVVANELYAIKKLLTKYRVSPKMLMDEFEKIVNAIVDVIKNTAAQPIWNIENDEDKRIFTKIISNIATISLNNDHEKGAFIGEVFAQLKDPGHGFINIEISETDKTTYDTDRGFEISRGMILPEMVTEADNRKAVYHNPLIITIKGNLISSDIDALRGAMDYIITILKRPLVIIAGGFSNTVTETIRRSIIGYAEHKGSQLPLLCIEMDTNSVIGKENLLDLQANIGSRIIVIESGKGFPVEGNPTNYIPYCGTCEKIVSSVGTYTRIIRGNADNVRVQFRVEEINKELERLKSEYHINNYLTMFKLNRRKAALLNDMITISVGGNTLEEKENLSYLFDDAVRGCKSAVINGVVMGGNTIVPRICKYHKDLWIYSMKQCSDASSTTYNFEKLHSAIYKVIERAYTNVYATILNNRFHNFLYALHIAKKCIKTNTIYNLTTSMYEDISMKFDNTYIENTKNGNIINSAELDIQILKAAASMIRLVVASNQFLRVPEIEQMKKNM